MKTRSEDLVVHVPYMLDVGQDAARPDPRESEHGQEHCGKTESVDQSSVPVDGQTLHDEDRCDDAQQESERPSDKADCEKEEVEEGSDRHKGRLFADPHEECIECENERHGL
jgi:hypothetical protein